MEANVKEFVQLFLCAIFFQWVHLGTADNDIQ